MKRAIRRVKGEIVDIDCNLNGQHIIARAEIVAVSYPDPYIPERLQLVTVRILDGQNKGQRILIALSDINS